MTKVWKMPSRAGSSSRQCMTDPPSPCSTMLPALHLRRKQEGYGLGVGVFLPQWSKWPEKVLIHNCHRHSKHSYVQFGLCRAVVSLKVCSPLMLSPLHRVKHNTGKREHQSVDLHIQTPRVAFGPRIEHCYSSVWCMILTHGRTCHTLLAIPL